MIGVDVNLFQIAEDIAIRHARRRWFGGVDLVAKIRLRGEIYNALLRQESA